MLLAKADNDPFEAIAERSASRPTGGDLAGIPHDNTRFSCVARNSCDDAQSLPVYGLHAMETIHSRIKARRIALKMSMEQLADQLGVSYQTIQQWENEPDPNNPEIKSTAPRRTRMEEVARVLRTTVTWLATGRDESGNTTDPNEAQILMFYRGMTAEGRELFEQQGNALYNMARGNRKGPSDPYSGKKPPKEKK